MPYVKLLAVLLLIYAVPILMLYMWDREQPNSREAERELRQSPGALNRVGPACVNNRGGDATKKCSTFLIPATTLSLRVAYKHREDGYREVHGWPELA